MTVPFFQVVIIIPTSGHRRLDLFFSGRNYVKIGFGGNVMTGKKTYSRLAGYVFQRVQITTKNKLQPEKNVQSSGRQLETGKIYVRKKQRVQSSLVVGWRNHNTHHRHNNKQDEPCHPTLQRLCPLSLHGWSSGATKSWHCRSPTPCAGRNPLGLRLLSLVCSLGEAK